MKELPSAFAAKRRPPPDVGSLYRTGLCTLSASFLLCLIQIITGILFANFWKSSYKFHKDFYPTPTQFAGEIMVDILVLGATGYMGRLITEVLQNHRERPAFSFGIAARSLNKLEKVKEDLKLDTNVQTFEFDVTDPQQVEAVVSQAAVIINTVGPYWNWGTAVVNACLKHGKHYVDLTGETPWIRKVITDYDYLASRKHCVIIPSCGLDSLPSDLTVFLANKTLKTLVGPETDIETSISAIRLNTAVSAGSFRTFISYFEDVPSFIRQLSRQDFYLSNVHGVPNPPNHMTNQLPLSNPPIYGAVYVMAGVNRAIVHRSWGLHEYDMRKSLTSRTPEKRLLTYGPQFKYEEFLAVSSRASAVLTNIAIVACVVCIMFPPTRWILRQFLPLLPDGPSEAHKKDGFLEVNNVTTSSSTPAKAAVNVRTVVRGQGEGGYYLSSFMVTECALALLLSRHELPALGQEGGVLTPTTALGDVLVRRLEETGKFNFHSEVILGTDSETRKTR